MKNPPLLVAGLLVLTLFAFLFRVWQLEERPMHHDEANQAVRCGILQETGVYRYDPQDHHGPSLYYLSLPFAWLQSGRCFSATTVTTFRLVPVLFGVGLIPLLLLLRGAIKPSGLIVAGGLTAVSPALVFYSRFYIQEMLLLFFTSAAIACGWRYVLKPSVAWAAATGLFLGLMFATKETSVLAYASMAAGLVAVVVSGRSGWRNWRPRTADLMIAAAVSIGVSVILFTSFFENAGGLIAVWESARIYLSRGLGESLHLHPWYYYLKILVYTHDGRGPAWTEMFIVGLAVVGTAWAWAGSVVTADRRFVRFLAVYALTLTVLYSLIPHKTPWCLISFLHAMILLAGFAVVELWQTVKGMPGRIMVGLLFVAGFGHLTWLSWEANFRHEADPNNPYVYAQTTPDFLNLVSRVEEISRVSPRGRQLFVQVVADPYSTWPLPWYLRSYPKVGYWEDPVSALQSPLPDIVITTPELEPSLRERLSQGFQAEYYGLRPSVLLLVYIRQELWDEFIRRQAAAGRAPGAMANRLDLR